jgi:arylsulfatase A-like enzyme
MRPAALLALFLIGCQTVPDGPAARPNIIIVLTDDQGYGDLGCHGNPVLKTPHLDRLHAESIRLTDFHVAPMCTPTRGQLLTGTDALANGAMNVSSGRTLLRHGIPTIASTFGLHGYRTGLFGKWHLGENHPYRPQDRGFQESLWYPSSHIGSAPDYWNNDYFDDVYRRNGRLEPVKGYCTDVFFGEAMKWIKGGGDKPFLAYIPLAAAHGPLYVPQKYRDLYKDQPRGVASFFGMIANIDENMGKLEAFLRETGLRDNTIVIFMTDNGGTNGVSVYNAGMRGKKIDLYDGGHRVPCFVRWPAGRLRPPGDVGALTLVQDIFPTVSEFCGVTPPQGSGVSLARLLRGEETSLPDRMAVIQFSRMNAPVPKKGDACVLWNKWRLVNDQELYDVAADPAQKTDVAAGHADIVAKMRGHYERWWAKVEPGMNVPERILLGTAEENPTLLSPCDWFDVFIDQSAQVRRGEAKSGVWHVKVERGGRYEFALRRWPVEADAAIAAGLPEVKVVDGTLPPGKALPVASARLKVGTRDERQAVSPQDKSVTFSLDLQAGNTEIQSWFLDGDGKELSGAYYVTVTRR